MATQATSSQIKQVQAATKAVQALSQQVNAKYPVSGSSGGSSSSSTYYKDAPGYVAGSSPTDSAASRAAYAAGPVPTQSITPQATLTTPIDTTKPSPQTAQVNAPNAQTDMANAIAGKGSALTSAEMANPQAMGDYATQYKKANALMAGKPAPTDAGQFGVATKDMQLGQQPQDGVASWQNAIGVAPEIENLFGDHDLWMSPDNQRQTLVQEYQQMSKSLGIEQLNMELIDAKAIIEGNEDMIRNEITAAGGLATDSQVLAMANARNKSLIVNYNKLIDLKTASMGQLDTMMNLSMKDRELANQEFDRKMNFAFKVAEFKERFVNNSRTMISKFADTMGWDMIPLQDQKNVAKLFGITPDMLSQMASRSATDRATKAKDLQFISGTANQPSGVFDKTTGSFTPMGGGGANAGEPVTPYKSEIAVTGRQAVFGLLNIAEKNPGIFGRTAAMWLPDAVRSDAFRNYKAQLDFLKGNIIPAALTSMREASKTGGALGQVSDREGAWLGSSLGALDMSQSPDVVKAQLRQIDAHLKVWQDAVTKYGGQGLQITAPTGEGIIIID